MASNLSSNVQFRKEVEILRCGPFVIDHWLPHAFIWLVAIPYLVYLSKREATPRNKAYKIVYLLRVVLAACAQATLLLETVILVSTGFRISAIHDLAVSQVTAICINILSQAIVTGIMFIEFKKGYHPPVIPATFWFCLMSSKIGVLQAVVLHSNDRELLSLPYANICMPHVTMTGAVFLYCFISDFCIRARAFLSTSSELFKSLQTRKIDPYFWTFLISKISFLYTLRDMWTANRQRITVTDLDEYQPGDGSKALLNRVEEMLTQGSKSKEKTSIPSRFRLFLTIVRSVIGPTFIMFIVRLFHAGFTLATVLSLRELLAFIDSTDENNNWGLVLVFRFSFISLLQDLCASPWYYITYYSGAQIKGLLNAFLIKQYMSMPAYIRQDVGADITSYITVDVHRIADIFTEANYGFEILLLLLPGIYMLVNLLGPSGFLGIVFVFLVFSLNLLIFKKGVLPLKSKEMQVKDQRLKLMQSILKGIRILKSYTWEKPFGERVSELRKKELSYLWKIFMMQGLGGALAMVTPYLATCLMTVTYVLSSSKNEVTADRIFTAMVVMRWFSTACIYTPNALHYVVQGYVSMKRVLEFLHTSWDMDLNEEEERNTTPDRDNAIEIEDGTFAWKSDTPVLQGINLTVSRGELVAILGKVGSGKSSLLAAILGELKLLSGRISKQGSVAYTSQMHWTFCDTVRENILFGQEFDERRYHKVIEACALKPDIESMPWKDQWEIGEHSLTLSGGQKHRISLARAVYADKDLYLLDDPLSAVDVRVAVQLFNQVIGPEGLLKEKTRILVTHSIQCLENVDKIIVVDGGKIIQSGTYQQLMSSGCHVVQYLQEISMKLEAEVNEKPSKPLIMEKYRRRETKFVDDLQVGYELVSVHTLVTYLRAGGIWKAFFIFILALAIAGLQVGTNLWLGQWSSDWRTNSTAAIELSRYRLSIFVALGSVQGVLVLICLWVLVYIVLNAADYLHQQLLEKTLHTETACFDYIPSGILLNCFTKDTDNIDTGILSDLWLMMYVVTYTLGIIILIAITVPVALIPTAVAIIFGVILSVGYNRYAVQIMMLDGSMRSPLFSWMNAMKNGVVLICTYGRLNLFCDKFYQLNDSSTRALWIFAAVKQVITSLGAAAFDIVGLIVSLICLYKRFEINPSLAAGCVYVLAQSADEVTTILRCVCKLAYNLVSVERVSRTNYLKPEDQWYIEKMAPPKKWPSYGEINFIDYSSKYPTSANPVLSHLTFSIKQHEKIGIVGRTGAGKSSLTAGLLRMLIKIDGKIEIDGINIECLGLHDLRSRITLITQDPIIFDGTLCFNLDPFGRHDEAEIWTVLEQVHLKDVIQLMPEGLASKYDADGFVLSTGQRQLLCLARALLQKPKVLILDEPTASVDVHTDHLIQETLRTHLHECTLITVAHRIKTIIDYDRVMVMEGGRIAELDAPASLLADERSAFYTLAKTSGIIV